MLHGRLLSNHSYVSLDELGQGPFDSLLCLTDKDIYNIQPREGQWYFPNGTQVPIKGTGWSYYRSRDTKVVQLHQRNSLSRASGIFRCEVQDVSGLTHTLFAGVFSLQEGSYN